MSSKALRPRQAVRLLTQPSKQPRLQGAALRVASGTRKGRMPRAIAASRLGEVRGPSRSLVRLREQAPHQARQLAPPVSWSASEIWLAQSRERCAVLLPGCLACMPSSQAEHVQDDIAKGGAQGVVQSPQRRLPGWVLRDVSGEYHMLWCGR